MARVGKVIGVGAKFLYLHVDATVMLIRFFVENVLSFGEMQEFSMVPDQTLSTLPQHKYTTDSGIEALKLGAIYGSNGAGKSNLIKAVNFLRVLILEGSISNELLYAKNKFCQNTNDTMKLAIEFANNQDTFYYGVELANEIIVSESLYLILGNEIEDQLIFERATSPEMITTINFSSELEQSDKIQAFKNVLLGGFVNPNKLCINLLLNKEFRYSKKVENAIRWFKEKLIIINPKTKPISLIRHISENAIFRKYASNLLSSFDLGIENITIKKTPLHESIYKKQIGNNTEIIEEMNSGHFKLANLIIDNELSINLEKVEDKIMINELNFVHLGPNDTKINFSLSEESDGTKRLLDFIPAIADLENNMCVIIIDEIERSIHPSMIKALINKFSTDNETKGQLIFTTHESNLLDQSILREDEIWFAQKKKSGFTSLYSLNVFKDLDLKNIQKGYFGGRFGAIPFLGNLNDINLQYEN